METQEQEQSKFSGWAIVDVLGKQRYIGFVRTETYGSAAMFRVDVPGLPEREYVLESPEYVNGQWTPAGSKVQRPASAGYTKLIGSNSIYMLSPCDEAAAMKAIEATNHAPLKLIELAPDKRALVAAIAGPDEDDDDDPYEDDVPY